MRRLSQNGYASVYLMLISGLLATISLANFGIASTLLRVSNQGKIKIQSQTLQESFEFIFKNPSVCRSTLLQGSFLEELHRRIQKPNQAPSSLTIPFPDSQNGIKKTFLKKDTQFDHLGIADVTLSSLSKFEDSTGLLAILKVEYADVEGIHPKASLLPVYAYKKSNGEMECFATSLHAGMETSEDFLCSNLKGTGFRYDPARSKCVN